MPKVYITGNNADGLSCVTEIREITPGAFMSPWAGTGPIPTVVKANPRAKLLKLPQEPGVCRTLIATWKEGQYNDPHRTTSVDVNVCLYGSMIMGLETGEVLLRGGDVVVLPGTVHYWKGTAEGGAMFYAIQGSQPTAEDLTAETVEPADINHGG